MNGHSNEQEHQNGDLHKRSLGQFILESGGKKKNKSLQGKMHKLDSV